MIITYKQLYYWLFIIILILISIVLCENDIQQSKEIYTLVDDFNFDQYQHNNPKQFWYQSKWLVDDEPENLCTGMNIYQYSCHRKQNVQVSKDGHLELIANVNRHGSKHATSKTTAKTDSSSRPYERFIFDSAKIQSNKSWLYGKFEMRAILPEGRFLRPVFILKPVEPAFYSGDWLDNGQINGLVYVQQHSAIIAGIHYRMVGGQTYMGRKLYTQRNITKTFNRYTVEWTNQTIRWMFNDFVFFEHNVTKPFDQKFQLVLQLGVGGPEFDSRGGVMRIEDAKYWINNRFIIDYIKVYQKQFISIGQQQQSSSTINSLNHQKILFIIIIMFFNSNYF